MNSYTAVKIGEVLAFANTGLETLEKGEKGFLDILDEKHYRAVMSDLQQQQKEITDFIEKSTSKDEVATQAKETEEKVVAMRDMYLEGKWDDANELLEWMGFHTGAALVHWYLIQGVAEKMQSPELLQISKSAVSFYKALISSDEEKLREMGHTKV